MLTHLQKAEFSSNIKINKQCYFFQHMKPNMKAVCDFELQNHFVSVNLCLF
ncbi:hypothetical protein OIU79_001643 [Salix purpurea]|uniref:Uncharacterized protein n=1 Tax=Salix purpurea TaxID=77065 RepID=A0A9Q0UQW6_SALPP|nr:hypothetical protein OIU79_001643 [Salix purpurea]